MQKTFPVIELPNSTILYKYNVPNCNMGKAIIICITLFSAQLFCIVVYRLAPDLVVDVDLRVRFWGYFTLLFRDPGRYHATKSRRRLETDVLYKTIVQFVVTTVRVHNAFTSKNLLVEQLIKSDLIRELYLGRVHKVCMHRRGSCKSVPIWAPPY